MSTAYNPSYNVSFNDSNELIISNVGSASNYYPIFASYDDIEIEKSNIHINKQRAQSKINGKNSRWC